MHIIFIRNNILIRDERIMNANRVWAWVPIN